MTLAMKWIAFLFAALLAAVSPATAADLTVDAASDFLIDATINGQPVRLRVDPKTSGYVILNPATVARLGLRRSMIGSRTQVGPVRLTGSSKVAEIVDRRGDRRPADGLDRPAGGRRARTG